MIRSGNGPRGISTYRTVGIFSDLRAPVARSGNRAFSGLPTMTSSSGSHSLQLQTADSVAVLWPFSEYKVFSAEIVQPSAIEVCECA